MKVKHFFRAVFVCSVLGILPACGGGSHQSPVLGPDGQPTGQVVQQQDSPGLLGMFGASMAGSMVGNWLSGSRGGSVQSAPSPSHSTTIVNRTIVNKTVVVQPTSKGGTTPTASTPIRPPVVSTSPVVKPPTPSIRPSVPVVSGTRSWGSSSRSSSFSSSRGGRR